mmetsp:Transcript_24081/g.67485  ORF Transcript_24081/g.67485 Transcript_24081/m.67485 type:complete len:225 (+) Transcript_24081:353-1027(+)
MQTWMIFWLMTPFTNSCPISRTFPSIRRFTAFSSFSLFASGTSLRASYWPLAPSNSSWQVLSSTRRKDMGLESPSGGGNSGSSLDSRKQSSAYRKQKVGSATAFSKMVAMAPLRMSLVVIFSRSCMNSRSNFSGVSLLRIPRMLRIARSPSLPATLGAQALRPRSSAFCILARGSFLFAGGSMLELGSGARFHFPPSSCPMPPRPPPRPPPAPRMSPPLRACST